MITAIGTIATLTLWIGLPSAFGYSTYIGQEIPLDYWLIWGFVAVVNLRIARYIIGQPVNHRSRLATLALGLGPLALPVYWRALWQQRQYK